MQAPTWTTHRRPFVAAAAVALAVGGLGLTSAPVQAAKGGTCQGYTVSTGGRTFTGDQDRTIPASQVGPTISVSGRYTRFTVASSTFETRNYTLTGADSP